MLAHSNAKISVSRIERDWWKIWEAQATSITDYEVYIQQRWQRISDTFWEQWAFNDFILLTDGLYELLIWDIVNDWTDSYKIKGWAIFSDITGKHWQYEISKIKK